MLHWLNDFPSRVALIVGDVILDEYIWGDVTRISPEAPVPIVRTLKRTYRPGGAANVAANIAALGGAPFVGGVIGADAYGECLRTALLDNAIPQTDGLHIESSRPTTVKTRVVAHSQQMLRLDTETQEPITRDTEDAILSWYSHRLPAAHVCILSDYAKGVLTAHLTQSLIAAARAAHRPVIIDPKGSDFSKYRGATLVTPNAHEAQLAAGQSPSTDLDDTAAVLLSQLGGAALLITRGAEGMSLYRAGDAPVHIPTTALRVFDVSGAGDTVIATLALALAVGAPLPEAAALANHAAAVVVGKFGTATVTLDELRAAF